MFTVLRQVGLGLVVVLLQWLVFGRLPLWGVVPDIVLLFVALVAIRYGRLPGAVAGFSAGLLMDLLVNPHLLGLNAILKTLLGFVIGFFRSEQGAALRLVPVQAFVGALVVAVVHNGLMTILLALDQNTRTLFLVFGLWLGAALYTAVVALVGTLFKR
jgi:rod shape-determining protein MreD